MSENLIKKIKILSSWKHFSHFSIEIIMILYNALLKHQQINIFYKINRDIIVLIDAFSIQLLFFQLFSRAI